MVLRLFVQPDEGKHWIVPKRGEPLAANATLQNSVIASTALAAGYTSYARTFSRRVGYNSGLSGPALFVKSSARAGIWCAAVGAAVNTYYHYTFTKPVIALSGIESTPFQVWEKSEKYTVDDGLLAGAGIGLASAVFLRRAPIGWWTKFVGMSSIGAFCGVVGSHSWFHYKGERQPAVAALEEWNKRRNLEFHWIYWNKVLMSKLSVPAQGYVILNGIFKSNSIPEEAYQTPEKYGIVGIAAAPEAVPYVGYYVSAYDPAENLRNIDVDHTREKIAEMESEGTKLRKEGDYILSELVRRHYDYCHDRPTEEDQRQQRQREIMLLEMCFNRLVADAEKLERKIMLWELSLQQKIAWESPAGKDDKIGKWTPKIRVDPARYIPNLCIGEATKIREQLMKDVQNFEATYKRATGHSKENTRKDLEEAKILLRAADQLVSELEEKAKLREGKIFPEKTIEQSLEEDTGAEFAAEKDKEEIKKVEGKATEDAQKPDDKDKKSPSSDMEPSKP